MEQSLIHEFSGMNSSSVFSIRQSFINTHISEDTSSELRRSRIQNLPSHRKEDLSGKLNFVVVFQTIEIERLSLQIESLRVKSKDWERQKNIAQNYQIQIRELTERCHFLEMQRDTMQSDGQRISIFCEKVCKQFQQYKDRTGSGEAYKEKYQMESTRSQQLQRQVEKWKNRYSALELAKGKQLEEIRSQFQTQRKSTISRQIKEMTIKFENQISNLMGQLKKSREEQQSRMKQISRLQEEISQFKMREDQGEDIERKVHQYQNKIAMLSQQNYRLNQVLRLKSEEMDRMKASEKEMKAKFEALKTPKDQLKRYKQELQGKAQENRQLNILISNLQQQNEKLSNDKQKGEKYQQLVLETSKEIERLTGLIHEKMNQLEQCQAKNKGLQAKINSMNVPTYQAKNYEKKIAVMTREQERLNQQLKSRLGNNQSLKQKCNELEKAVGKYETVLKQNKQLRQQASANTYKIQQLKARIKLGEDDSLNMENIQDKLKAQQEAKKDLLAQREKFNSTITNMSLQLETALQKSAVLQAQLDRFADIRASLSSYEHKISAMSQQIDKINAEIHRRVAELNQLKQTIKSLNNNKLPNKDTESKLIQSLQQMQKLVKQIESLQMQNERLQDDNIQLEASIMNLEGEVISRAHEKEEMALQIREKEEQFHQLQKQLDSKRTQARDWEVQNQTYKTKIQTMKASYEQLESRFKNEIKKSQKLTNDVQQMSAQVTKLKSEPKISPKLLEQISLLKKSGEQKNAAISTLKKRIDTIEGLLRNLKQKYTTDYELSQTLSRTAESSASKIETMEKLVDMLNWYDQELKRVQQINIVLESKQQSNTVQLDKFDSYPKEGGNQQLVGNFSFSKKISAESKSEKNSNLYSFKVTPHQLFQNNTKMPIKFVEEEQIRGMENSSVFREQDKQIGQEENGYKHNNDFNDTSSMANSIINTLITKESKARFENFGPAQYQSFNNPTFGKSGSVSKIGYIPSTNSPHRNSAQVYGNNSYLSINSQLDNQPYHSPVQNYLAPSPLISPVNRVNNLEDVRVKRTASYNQFHPYFSSNQNQYLYDQCRDAPQIRVLEAAQSPNIVNSTKKTTSQQARKIWTPDDFPRF